MRGQPEGQWLDAKGGPYALTGPNRDPLAAWELAKDVAAFANSPTGGLILLGATIRDRGDGETIAGFREFELNRLRRQAYRNHVAQKVFPRVVGFEVIWVERANSGRGLGLLVIPSQDDADKPFLVRGVVRDRRQLGAHMMWPVRREDDTAVLPRTTTRAAATWRGTSTSDAASRVAVRRSQFSSPAARRIGVPLRLGRHYSVGRHTFCALLVCAIGWNVAVTGILVTHHRGASSDQLFRERK